MNAAKKTIDNLNIPVFILIRPRDGDFIYSDEEFELMKSRILLNSKKWAVKALFQVF